nr:laccase-15-like [Ipomoea trifida]
MWSVSKVLVLQFMLLCSFLAAEASVIHRHKFTIEETSYTKLCNSKKILTVNGKFPGPVLYATKGDTVIVDVYNKGSENITIHWHGVKMPRYPWADGPEFVTQCPIQPGTKFSQKIVLSDEEGTLWWHAHSDWSRATVHGALLIYPKKGSQFPYPKPSAEVPIILDTFKLTVEYGKTYLLRMVNAVMNNIMFFSIANHNITVVGSDGSYMKHFTSDYIAISPGQTIDFLLEANQPRNHYYMAARAYSSAPGATFNRNITTAIVEYRGNYTPSTSPIMPNLPVFNDTNSSVTFTAKLKSLADKKHPIDVPLNVTTNLLYTVSLNTLPCPNNSCAGPRGSRFSASINNLTFALPRIDILQAYYKNINQVFTREFPDFPPLNFNFTASNLSVELRLPDRRTEVKVLEYGTVVELVFQGTNLLSGIDHPMHLHGYSFYVVGWGFGNFNKTTDPKKYNLVDPPLVNTISVPRNGWTAIRFKADNPEEDLQDYSSADPYLCRNFRNPNLQRKSCIHASAWDGQSPPPNSCPGKQAPPSSHTQAQTLSPSYSAPAAADSTGGLHWCSRKERAETAEKINQGKEGLENAVPKFNGSDGGPMKHHEKFCEDIARWKEITEVPRGILIEFEDDRLSII